MVLGGVQAFNLVSILLLILPGWLGVKLYLNGVERSDRLGRIDTVVVSIVVSLCGLLILAVFYTLWLLVFSYPSSPWYPTVRQLSPLVQAPVLVIINYANLVVVASILGLYCAYSGRLIGQLPDAPNKVWRTRLEAVEKSPGGDKIRVVTTDGDRITGELGNWSVDSRDLVVEDPKWTEVGVSGDDRILKNRRGSVYIRDSRIARVYVEGLEDAERRDSDGETAERNETTNDLIDAAKQDADGGDEGPDDVESSDSNSNERQLAVARHPRVLRVHVLQQVP